MHFARDPATSPFQCEFCLTRFKTDKKRSNHQKTTCKTMKCRKCLTVVGTKLAHAHILGCTAPEPAEEQEGQEGQEEQEEPVGGEEGGEFEIVGGDLFGERGAVEEGGGNILTQLDDLKEALGDVDLVYQVLASFPTCSLSSCSLSSCSSVSPASPASALQYLLLLLFSTSCFCSSFPPASPASSPLPCISCLTMVSSSTCYSCYLHTSLVR